MVMHIQQERIVVLLGQGGVDLDILQQIILPDMEDKQIQDKVIMEDTHMDQYWVRLVVEVEEVVHLQLDYQVVLQLLQEVQEVMELHHILPF